jgi:glycerol kinase
MLLSIDQSTYKTSAFIFNREGILLAQSESAFSQIYPKPSWVEHDPNEIWNATLSAIKKALFHAKITPFELCSIGITNQRETTVLWNKITGEPVYNAIVWQCRRSEMYCKNIHKANKANWIQEKTGLRIDAYFSATKIQWLIKNNPNIQQLANEKKLYFGTMDTWLIWKLSGHKIHATDHTNASRTLLYNIKKQAWDPELLCYFQFDQTLLPTIQASASFFGLTDKDVFWGASIPITGVAGDQQAALFGHQCIQKGMTKNTYGTGCFLLMYLGKNYPFIQKRTITAFEPFEDSVHKTDSSPSQSHQHLLTSMACDSKGQPAYCLEGSIFSAGSAIQWLRDAMGFIDSVEVSSEIASSIQDTQGVYMVPAFTGLGAPYWDMQARGIITGLTQGSGKNEIIRATLESIAYQTHDLVLLMEELSGIKIPQLHVDGGACQNDFLMQFQSDILNRSVHRSHYIESTAIGAVLLAGIGAHIWDHDSLPSQFPSYSSIFSPKMLPLAINAHIKGWKKAIQKTQK